MTTKNPHFLPRSKKSKLLFVWVGSAFIFLGFLASLATIQKAWGALAIGFCVFYTLAMTFFFAAQVWGFIVSQTTYSDSVEDPKYHILKLEEAEWGR